MERAALICFDFEGSYGMPFRADYDLADATSRILGVLADAHAEAVFFVVGKMIRDRPDVIRQIADRGHEIGLHGYEHEDMGAYDRARLAWTREQLREVGDTLQQLVGRRPIGFRAPHLLGPTFRRPEISTLLHGLGYSWISNREVRYPVELFRPGRAPGWSRDARGRPRAGLDRSRVLLTLLNCGLLANETFGGSVRGRHRWLTQDRSPFVRDGLVEVPLYGPLDCDLLGLPRPDELTGPELLTYARGALTSSVQGPRPLAMVTFHDWLVAGGNRLDLLASALDAASAAGRRLRAPQNHPGMLGGDLGSLVA